MWYSKVDVEACRRRSPFDASFEPKNAKSFNYREMQRKLIRRFERFNTWHDSQIIHFLFLFLASLMNNA